MRTQIETNSVREYVQACPWFSGPVLFLALKNEKDNEMFKWTDEEIRQNT
jgi:hypothetical protein